MNRPVFSLVTYLHSQSHIISLPFIIFFELCKSVWVYIVFLYKRVENLRKNIFHVTSNRFNYDVILEKMLYSSVEKGIVSWSFKTSKTIRNNLEILTFMSDISVYFIILLICKTRNTMVIITCKTLSGVRLVFV
jgi:hypothetical protein